jgi:cell wall-associated NlpC family hydrolase
LRKNEIASLSNTKSQEAVETVTPSTHQVKAKESLYVIAKQYGITLKELQNANPNIGKKGLSIGQVITIPKEGKLVINDAVADNAVVKIKETPVAEIKNTVPVIAQNTISQTNTTPEVVTTEIIHTVSTKETKYGIAKKYGITVADLERQNPAIQQRLNVGLELKIQVPNNSIVNPIQKQEEIIAVSQIESKQDSVSTTIGIANADLIEQLIQSASDKIGTRYRTGGTTTAGFDCSGLMCNTFGAFDIKLPRTSIEQSSFGEKIEDNKAQKGDLIFFRTNGRSRINHVGMVVEVAEDEIKFIHSSTHSGVIISSTKESYYQRHFAQVNRVLK